MSLQKACINELWQLGKVSEQMSRYFARHKSREAIRSKNSLELSEFFKDLNGSRLLVYVMKNSARAGPFHF